MKLACIVGARPNFIKIAPIMKELARKPDAFQPLLVHTGQHYDGKMSDVFFRDLGIPTPDFNLGVGSGSPAQQTGAILERFDDLCVKENFDRVLVVGDVTSTLACAITAAKRWIPVDHVEAGLRSFDRTMPEEINRVATDSLADHCFVTEPAGVQNLLREGHAPEKIKFVGNVMIDSLRTHVAKALALRTWNQFSAAQGAYALVTLHRPSNVDDPAKLRALVAGLERLSARLPMIFPVHPRTRKNLDVVGGRLTLCEPLGYLEFLGLMAGAKLVITDSGGIQEETTALGIPCLTMRLNTERPVTVDVGTNTLVGEDLTKLEEQVAAILGGHYKPGRIPELWDGQTARRIVEFLAAL
ncbi:MAG: UDP-N-acetylglucosamine 2-epimerase (non-hydrolyzing) [Verrucomicrobia bacterium]|nr:UDP-N-acetylglucosamine 2-epimerase (non-hydrolyzing) [Verrucomicrobiota bacterium]